MSDLRWAEVKDLFDPDLMGALPAAADLVPRRSDAEVGDLRVWPVPGVPAIFRPMSEELVEFDVDLRELQGQYGHPVLGFDPGADRVVLLTDARAGAADCEAVPAPGSRSKPPALPLPDPSPPPQAAPESRGQG